MSKSLAIKYRPTTFEEVIEQNEIKLILKNQLNNNDIRNAYLFVGGAGTGKTTCARIFAKMINNGKGNAIEIDGASNNGVDQIREISVQAKTRAVDSEYKVFIIDECHMITIQGWNAMLKLIEEPPLKTIFIFCTTNPEKVPKTILSRVQRYDFKRISELGIYNNLVKICNAEGIKYEDNALAYISKLANGHMRDAITMLDKCSAYSTKLTEENVVTTLGRSMYADIGTLFSSIISTNEELIIRTIEYVYEEGIDLKQFIDDEITFILDYIKWKMTNSLEYCSCPSYIEEWFRDYSVTSDVALHYLNTLIQIKETIKYDNTPKDVTEAMLILESEFIRNHQ